MFYEISPKEIEGNFISQIADEWALLAAGDSDGFNMMTVSWGFAGEIWGKDSIAVFVRPQRHTLNFTEKSDYFTVSFYGDNKEIHRICGKLSGKDVDKAALTGLTPVFSDSTVYFEQARLVMICKKQYADWFKEENFCDKSALTNYPNKDYHRFYIGKIEKVLVNKG